jgi:hypothetical protein
LSCPLKTSIDPFLAPPVVDRLTADTELATHLRDLLAGIEKIEDTSSKTRADNASP